MKPPVIRSRCKSVLVLLACAWMGLLVVPDAGAGPKKNAAPAGKPPKNAPADPASAARIPQSVFVIPSNAKEGRNPFFPSSMVDVPVAPKFKPGPVAIGTFTLNGITSPPKPTAIVNGQTLAPGEQGEVRMPGGAKELVLCEAVGPDYAIIVVNGQRRELHLRAGF